MTPQGHPVVLICFSTKIIYHHRSSQPRVAGMPSHQYPTSGMDFSDTLPKEQSLTTTHGLGHDRDSYNVVQLLLPIMMRVIMHED